MLSTPSWEALKHNRAKKGRTKFEFDLPLFWEALKNNRAKKGRAKFECYEVPATKRTVTLCKKNIGELGMPKRGRHGFLKAGKSVKKGPILRKARNNSILCSVGVPREHPKGVPWGKN